MDSFSAQKNDKAIFSDLAKIISGIFLTVIVVAIVLIFRRAPAFLRGKVSMLDVCLLFLYLTISLSNFPFFCDEINVFCTEIFPFGHNLAEISPAQGVK